MDFLIQMVVTLSFVFYRSYTKLILQDAGYASHIVGFQLDYANRKVGLPEPSLRQLYLCSKQSDGQKLAQSQG